MVCGCDGAPYANACEARRLQVSHDESTTCDLCRPALPATVGTCTTLLGYAWDGGRCSAVRGCSCSEGCDRLYPSLAGCTSARTPCLAFPCGALSCRRWEEICVHTGADTRCDPLPGTCEGVPTCACIAATTCAELGAGAFEVTP